MNGSNPFGGADRVSGYDEGAIEGTPADPPSPVAQIRPMPPAAPSRASAAVTALREQVDAQNSRPVEPTGLFVSRRRRREYEQALIAWEREQRARVVRASTGGAVTIMMLNTKGGVGKTPAVLCLANALAAGRGGTGVAAWEAADEKGTLLDRVNGEPGMGLVELLRNARALMENPSQVEIDKYAARLSTGARVFGSREERDLWREADVETVHELLTRTYELTIMDTANALRSDAALQAILLADLVVLPITVNIDAAVRMLQIAEILEKGDPVGRMPHRPELFSRTVVVLSLSEPEVDPSALEAVTSAIEALQIPWHVVPYDPHIKNSVALEWERMTDATREAWSQVAATVMQLAQTVSK